MKINFEAGAFMAAATPVEKAVSLNVHSDGVVSITSDAPGAKLAVVDASEDGKIRIVEELADGSTGDEIEFSVVLAPAPAEAEVED